MCISYLPSNKYLKYLVMVEKQKTEDSKKVEMFIKTFSKQGSSFSQQVECNGKKKYTTSYLVNCAKFLNEAKVRVLPLTLSLEYPIQI